jgi:capsule polysaccharide export protein KpsE/RkpR
LSSTPVRQPTPDAPAHDFPEAVSSPETSRPSDDLVAHLRMLWEHRSLLLRLTLLALVVSTLVAILIPARYQSTARLMPPESQSTSGIAAAVEAMSGNAGGLGGIASNILSVKSTSDTFVGILSSRTVQDNLIQQFDLKRLFGDSRMEDARRDLAARTGFSVDRKSQIITITVTDHDAKRAAAMCQAYVEALNRLVAELSTSSARRERIFLEERLQSVSEDLEAAEKEFSQFSSKNTAIDIKEQGKAMVEAASRLSGQLIAAESELQGLRQIYTDNNVRVRSVRARIDELKYQLQKIGGKNEGASTSPGRDSPYPSIRELPLLGVTYADLYRRTRVQEAVFETLTKEYELAKVQEAKEIPTVKVLDSPIVPDKRSFPPRLLIMLSGTALTFVLAAAWLNGKKAWDRTDANEPGRALAREVFTTMQTRMPKFSWNGAGTNGRRSWVFWPKSGDSRVESCEDEGSDKK